MSTEHTPEPWFIRTDCVVENMKFIHSEKTGWHICSILNVDRGRADAQRIIECVNACAGQNIEVVKLATQHREDCLQYESTLEKIIAVFDEKEVKYDTIFQDIKALKEERDKLLMKLKTLKNFLKIDEENTEPKFHTNTNSSNSLNEEKHFFVNLLNSIPETIQNEVQTLWFSANDGSNPRVKVINLIRNYFKSKGVIISIKDAEQIKNLIIENKLR